MKQNIIFTALPNGYNAKTKNKQISVAISLQVMDSIAGTKLSAVPDMLNWAQLINTAKFVLYINGAMVQAKKISKPADEQLWKNLFSPTINVDKFDVPDKTKTPILSYPVKHIVDYIKFIAEATGKKFTTDMPDANYYTENPFFTALSNYKISPLTEKGRNEISLNNIAHDNNNGDKVKRFLGVKNLIPFAKEANPTLDFAQLANFHGIYDVKPVNKFVPFKKPDFEFHQILSVLSQYPSLMRRLGLVIDFEIIPTAFSTLSPNPAVRIYPTDLNFSIPTVLNCPGTAIDITDKGFYAKADATSFHNKGYAKINSDAFTVFQLDTDGAALKLTSHIDALQLKKAKHIFYAYGGDIKQETFIPLYNNELTPQREGLPSNRTAGISIAKNGMAEHLQNMFLRMNDLKAAFVAVSAPPSGIKSVNATYVEGSKILFADDITMGYRMDVKMTDKPGSPDSWHSLHFHNNAFSFLNSSNKNVAINDLETDEGFIQLSTTEDKNIDGPHMKLSEVIARWEGWSLSVPMPGKGLNEPLLENNEVENNDADEAKKFETPSDASFKLNVFPKIAEGSLPKLRFGQTYAVKLRMVDLAGNSVDYDSEPEVASEAIAANIRYRRYEPVDAPFLIAGNIIKDGESTEVMVIRSNEGTSVAEYEKSWATKYKEIAIRHVKPPRTTVNNAITHGQLEKAIGKGNALGAKAIYEKITTEKDPKTKDDATYKDAVIINGDSNITSVEYLADPMVAGVSIFLSALDPNPKPDAATFEKFSKRCSFYFDNEVKTEADANTDIDFDKWMSPKPFRIILTEGNNFDISWSGGSDRIIKISVPKGYMLKMNYACFWKPKDVVKLSGMLNLMGLNNLSDAVGQSIAKGQHWMFSPWRTLSFVHAVQQPLTQINAAGKKLPVINDISTVRNYGDTFAGININMDIHGPSTGVMSIDADWEDWVDDGISVNTNGYDIISQKAKVFHFTSLYLVNNYVFGDFPAKKIINNPFKALPHQFNDTKHRFVNYKTIASTRYKEYFFNLIKEKGDLLSITRESVIAPNINILSSARPLVPQIAYVIPTFEWDRETKGDTIFTGRGSGLRVYLKRPWYTSGQGEKLAIVLMPPMNSNALFEVNTKPLENIFTTWGNDPTKISPPIPGGIFPDKKLFIGVKKGDINNLYAEDGLTLTELDGARASIVAYDVKYDTDRQMYYADIMVNFGLSYFPFIKLALAAYQQHSIRKNEKDCCLSKIVHADYVQVPPPRASSFKKNGAHITVAISGTLSNREGILDYVPQVEFVIEPIDAPSSEGVHISTGSKPIDSYSAYLQQSDIKNFTFYSSHDFNLPAEYATKPYRVKVFEYELITYDPQRKDLPQSQFFAGPPLKARMVFADVYEVNNA